MAMSESSKKAMLEYVPSYLAESKWLMPNGLLALLNYILRSIPAETEKPNNGLCMPFTAPSPKSARPVRHKSPNATQYKVYVLSLVAEYEWQHRHCTAKEAINYAIDRFEEETGIRLSYEQVRNWYNDKGKSNASTTSR